MTTDDAPRKAQDSPFRPVGPSAPAGDHADSIRGDSADTIRGDSADTIRGDSADTIRGDSADTIRGDSAHTTRMGPPTPMWAGRGATGGGSTTRLGPLPPPPPSAPRSSTADTSGSSGRPGLPVRSYLAVALTAALGAGAVVAPSQLLDDEASVTTAAESEGEGEVTPQETAATEAPTVEPLPGAVAGSQVASIAERLSPSVLRIDVVTANGQGVGSGVVYDTEGHVITNNHVIEDATRVSVLTPDGQRYDAEVVGADPNTDIAVLLVDADQPLPVPSFAGDEPTVGELAVAIGSPFSQDTSVTAGIVSGLGRVLQAPDVTLFDLVQTDAAINPGNSGGALINDSGEVIGINTAILSRSGANDGIGFAVPAMMATTVADDLIEFGEVRAGYLGVEGLTMTEDVAEAYGVDAASGAIIAAVEPGSPAADAGVQEGDIVVAFDGEEITSMTDLASLVRERDPGTTVDLTVLRDGERAELELTLGNRADA